MCARAVATMALFALACGDPVGPATGDPDAADNTAFDGGAGGIDGPAIDAAPDDAAATYDASPPDAVPIAHTMFVTSVPTLPSIGVGGLDLHCQTLATQQSLPGTWRAVLRIGGQPPSARITINGGVQNRLGQLVAVDSAGFFSGNALASVAVDETGDAPQDTIVWIGDAMGNDCKTWTAATTYMGGQAVSTNQSSWLTSVSTADCTLERSLYCIDQ